MTEAEQFLTELESYSKRAMMQPGDSSDMYESMDAFQGVANPAAVLRLVGMVREYSAEAARYKRALQWALIHRLYIYPDCGGKKCFREKGESCTLSYVECMTRRILEGAASGENPMMDAARGATKLLREAEEKAKS